VSEYFIVFVPGRVIRSIRLGPVRASAVKIAYVKRNVGV
jgi:hypothetical protein